MEEQIRVEELMQKLWESTDVMREQMAYYRCAMMEIETKFRVLDEQFSLLHDRNPIQSISTRLKSPRSIYEKLQRRGLPPELSAVEESICDIAGVRVQCLYEDDIYVLRDCLLSQDDIRLIKEKDYIRNPKPNGYRSLHLIVEVPIFLSAEKRPMKVEVQLRSVAMELWASMEHQLRYKKKLSAETQARIADELLECARLTELLDTKMKQLKQSAEREEE